MTTTRRRKNSTKSEKALKKFEDQASDLEAQALFAQTEDYMVAAWRVGAEKHATVASIADKYKLDPEMLERWVKFLKKKPTNYTFLVPWQKMVAAGGDARSGQDAGAPVSIKRPRTSTTSTPRSRPKMRNSWPRSKTRNEQFDPLPNGIKRKLITHQIDLKGMDREPSYLWTRLFEKDLSGIASSTTTRMEKRHPACSSSPTGHCNGGSSPDFSNHIDRMTKPKSRPSRRRCRRSIPSRWAWRTTRIPPTSKSFCEAILTPSATTPRALFLQVFSGGEPKPFTKGSGRLELADDIVKQPHQHACHRESHLALEHG